MLPFLTHSRLVFKREIGSLLSLPLYFILAGVFFTLTAIIFLSTLVEFAEGGSGQTVNATRSVIVPTFHAVHYFLMIQIPLLTMRSFSEDRANGMLDLLGTTPISDWALIMGKFLANAAAIAVYIGLTLLFPLATGWVSIVEWPVVIGSTIALFLAACGYIAIGLLASACTESQVIAAVISYVAVFSLVFSSFFVGATGIDALSDFAQHFSVLEHIDGLLSGNIAPLNLTYFALLIFVGLFITARFLEGRRWAA